MQTKIEPVFLYDGLGFPIELQHVEMVNIGGEWHPKIDVRYVADQVIKQLAVQETPLTGNQVKFIRSYFSMPLRAFGEKVVHESHTAVSKWEKKGDEPTNMNENTEQVLRLYIIEQTETKSEARGENFRGRYMRSRGFYGAKGKKPKTLRLDLCA
ncbi:hypothetical protein [Legionella israelensis]|uniref:Uncharacterized protein n=1 Tax=Legionella israelensis TaxID=454 RepID=A0A0W0W0T9_9GAMM|nr:hypothetical protein [Legionella israelensis]KTD26048.1 hypothetical protein Lisr_1189 [Legionella israelensis]QBS10161.1 hypothetical protein E4T55_10020 [Legionella israelensis]SCY26325.1 hypothetical protein SAMN02746069_01819 [Legionella israelensis DSM 19235]STX59752.1 Uncharacterised protein [Legionella israelensis]